MKPPKDTKAKPTCFVVMGYGKKTDFETGRVLDLNRSYESVIRPAVKTAGLTCIRSDGDLNTGLIDVAMYQYLLTADIVIADLSTSNKNAYYELGIRHALRPYATIVIAEDGIKSFPFDINHVVVRQYRHLGEDVGAQEAERFRGVLVQLMRDILAKQPEQRRDSPIYQLLRGLTPPVWHEPAATPAPPRLPKTRTGGQRGIPPRNSFKNAGVGDANHQDNDPADQRPPAATPPATSPPAGPTYAELLAAAEQEVRHGHWQQARTQLAALRASRRAQQRIEQEDPYLLQTLALATYRSQQPTEAAALQAARDLLAPLAPDTTNDTETLGLWGDVHKLRWRLTRDAAGPGQAATTDLDEAVRAYERGFYLRNDAYNGINLAFMLNQRAARHPAAPEAIADFVRAQQVRREVLGICARWLAAHPAPGAPPATPEQYREAETYSWQLATQAEAYLGLGQQPAADQALTQAVALAPEKWLSNAARQQLNELQAALATNSLQYVRP